MTIPINPLDGIVRILKADGQSTAGTGFFAGNSANIVTCAHVIKYADAEPGGSIQFVFHSDPEKRIYKAKVSSEGWRPPEAEDVAFLLPENGYQKPELVTRVSLGTSFYTQGRPLSTFGYPSSTPVEGQNGSCIVIGRTRVNGVEVLQLRSQEVSYGFSGAPVWDPASNFVVGMVSSFVPDGADRGRAHQETAFITPIELIRRVNPQLSQDDICPYRGVEIFEVEHKDVYFGRDEAIKEMIDGLTDNNVVAIVGVSGSGKSSLVRAGLARGLSQGESPELTNRQICFFKPGPAPFLNLLVALCSLDGRSYAQVESDFHLPPKSIEDADASGVREVLRDLSTDSIAQLLREHCRGKHVLLVADQFERLFNDCKDKNIQKRVIEILLKAASPEVKVLIVLRVDAYKTALENNDLAQAIKHSEVKLLSMDDDELKDTIVKPAQRSGKECEVELVNSLVTDVRGQAGDLPLLQFTLKELWESDAASGVLSKKSYDSLGYVGGSEPVTGVRGAIIKRAEEIWSTLEKEKKDKAAERIFTAVAMAAQPNTADEDLKAFDTSRRARLTEFDEKTREVISELTASFLLTTSMDPFTRTSVVEVSHEALIKNWPRLRNLVKTRRTFLNWYAQKLMPYLQRWQDAESPREKRKLLLPENMLPEASQWLMRSPDWLEGPPTVYVESSLRKQKWKRIFQGIGLTVVIAVLATIAYLFSVGRISKAEEFHQRGIQALRALDYQQAQLLLAKSLTLSDSAATRDHLLEARSNGAQGLQTTSPPGEILEMTPDGKWLAFANHEIVKLWDRSTGVEQATTFPAPDIKKIRIALSSDGKLMAFGDENGVIRLWDFTANQELSDRPPPRKESNGVVSAIDSITISPDGKTIAYGNMVGVIALWSRNSPGIPPTPTPGHGDTAIHCLAFSADGKSLVSGAGDATIIAWKVNNTSLTKEGTLSGHEDFITSVAFNSARQVASGAADGSVRVWDLDSGKPEKDGRKIEPVYLLIGHLGRVTSVAFSSDNSLIISGSEDQTVRVWNTSVRKEILTLSTGQQVTAVAFSDNDGVVSGGHYENESNTSVRQWRINRQKEGTTLYDTSQITAVSFHPSDDRVVFGGLSGPLKIYDPKTSAISTLAYDNAEPAIPTDYLDALVFNKVDGTLASGYYSGIVQLWTGNDLKPGRQLKIDNGKAVWGIAFHPTRPWIAVGGQDKKIHIWNTVDGSLVRVIDHDPASVWTIAFNSDGSLMASGGGDRKVRIWSIPDFNLKSTFSPPKADELWGVPFDNTDQKLITGGLDRMVRVWSLKDVLAQNNAEPLITFESHAGIIQSVAVGANSDWVASAGSDHTVGLWNLQTGKGLRLQLHDRPVWWVTFNHDGKLLASGGLDNRVRIVSMDAIAHIREAAPNTLLAEAQKDTCLTMNKDDLVYSPCGK